MLFCVGQKQSKPEHKNNRPNSAPQAVGKQQTSQRPQTALPQNQQRRKDQNPQHERTRQNRSAETRIVEQDRQYNNQSRNSRGSNQRRGRQRNPRAEISNEKNEVPKNKGTLSAQNLDSVQQEGKSDESVTSQGKEKEKAVSQQPETVKGGVQSGNKNLQPRDQRVGRDERPRNRERRRGGRRGGAEGQNTTNGKGPLNGPGEKRENGPIKDGPVDKGTLEKEDMKTAVSEQGKHDFKKSTNKEDGPIVVEKTVERKNEASSLQDGPVLNGVGTYTGSNTAHSLNGEHDHVSEKEGEVNKGALPQRRDRPSRRRGAQKDQKDGPGSQKHLNGTKPIENGTGEDHGKEESMAENKIQKSTENAQSEKQEVKSENQTTQELEKDLDKAGASKANGYIPLKEVNEVNIDR